MKMIRELREGVRLKVKWAPYANEYIPNISLYGEVILGKCIDSGGEADIYEIENIKQVCAKIYKFTSDVKPEEREAKLREREEKIDAMIRNRPSEPVRGRIAFAWPLGKLYDQDGRFVGYVMYFVSTAIPLEAMLIPNDVEWLKRFREKGISRNILRKIRSNPYYFRAMVVYNLVRAFMYLHSMGHAMGDVNPRNILVHADGYVTLIDTDSYIIRDSQTGKVYPCEVGVLDYTAPEVLLGKAERSPKTDTFAVGILVFQLLMDGYHPFYGVRKDKENAQIFDNIKDNVSVYLDRNAHLIVGLPRGAPPRERLYALDPELFKVLDRVLSHDPRNRASLGELLQVLERVVKKLEKIVVCDLHTKAEKLLSSLTPNVDDNKLVNEIANVIFKLLQYADRCKYPRDLYLKYPEDLIEDEIIDLIEERLLSIGRDPRNMYININELRTRYPDRVIKILEKVFLQQTKQSQLKLGYITVNVVDPYGVYWSIEWHGNAHGARRGTGSLLWSIQASDTLTLVARIIRIPESYSICRIEPSSMKVNPGDAVRFSVICEETRIRRMLKLPKLPLPRIPLTRLLATFTALYRFLPSILSYRSSLKLLLSRPLLILPLASALALIYMTCSVLLYSIAIISKLPLPYWLIWFSSLSCPYLIWCPFLIILATVFLTRSKKLVVLYIIYNFILGVANLLSLNATYYTVIYAIHFTLTLILAHSRSMRKVAVALVPWLASTTSMALYLPSECLGLISLLEGLSIFATLSLS